MTQKNARAIPWDNTETHLFWRLIYPNGSWGDTRIQRGRECKSILCILPIEWMHEINASKLLNKQIKMHKMTEHQERNHKQIAFVQPKYLQVSNIISSSYHKNIYYYNLSSIN